VAEVGNMLNMHVSLGAQPSRVRTEELLGSSQSFRRVAEVVP
jgi:hypothetical protein